MSGMKGVPQDESQRQDGCRVTLLRLYDRLFFGEVNSCENYGGSGIGRQNLHDDMIFRDLNKNGQARSLRGPSPAHRRTRRRSAGADDAGREGRPDVPHLRAGQPGRRDADGAGDDRPAEHQRDGAEPAHDPLQPGAHRVGPPDGGVAQPAAAAGRRHAAGHPGDHRLGPAPRVHQEPGLRLDDPRLLLVAGADRAGRHRRPGAGAGVRRYRPPGIPGRGHPHRAAPDGRSRHRAALGPHQRHVRGGRRALRTPDRGLHPRLPGRRRSAHTASPA